MDAESIFISKYGRSLGKNDSNGLLTCSVKLKSLWIIVLNILSKDYKDLESLASNHFVIGRISYSDCLLDDTCDKDIYRINHWLQVQMLTNHFWKYLLPLNPKSKCNTNESKIGIKNLFLVKEDNVKCEHRPLARVFSKHPVRDGIISRSSYCENLKDYT